MRPSWAFARPEMELPLEPERGLRSLPGEAAERWVWIHGLWSAGPCTQAEGWTLSLGSENAPAFSSLLLKAV